MARIDVVDDLDLGALRLFLSVVELGSVSQAARRSRISQPSATAKLRKLEAQLGVALVERSPTGSSPTEPGRRLLEAATDVVDAATAIVERADELADDEQRVAIATTRHVADHFLADWVARTRPVDLHLDITETDTLGATQAVRSGAVDLALVEGPHPPLGMRSIVVADEVIVPVVGRRHPWYGRRRAVTIHELSETTVILGRSGSGTRDVLEASVSDTPWARFRHVVEVPTASAARLAALAGTGVAFLPDCWARSQLASGALRTISIDGLTIRQPVRLAWRGGRPPSEPARRLADLLR